VNRLGSSLPADSNHGWQLLGETELSAGSNTDTIGTWLVELLTPLNLQADFVNQVLNSAQDAALRALQSNTGTSFERLHFSVFSPNELAAHSNTWGFFRIEKIDGPDPNKERADHVVEFYLYLEGE
jgi:hypothetical protein